MEQDEALDRVREIQRIVERTTLCTLLPGAPAVIGGALALAACAVNFAFLRSFDFAQNLSLSPRRQLALLVMWLGLAAVAVILDFILTARSARRQGFAPLGRPSRLAVLALTPTVLVAAIVTVKFLLDADYLLVVRAAVHGENLPATWKPAAPIEYLVPIWMMCYGLGVYSAGLLSIRAPRTLGRCFVAAGAIGLLFFPQYGLLLIALSFGLFHIVFGLHVMRKTKQGAQI